MPKNAHIKIRADQIKLSRQLATDGTTCFEFQISHELKHQAGELLKIIDPLTSYNITIEKIEDNGTY